jgi:hypothetical protein
MQLNLNKINIQEFTEYNWRGDLKLRTGDIILFKSYDKLYAPIFMNYYTHVAIIYVPPLLDAEKTYPLIFEANSIKDKEIPTIGNKKENPVDESLLKIYEHILFPDIKVNSYHLSSDNRVTVEEIVSKARKKGITLISAEKRIRYYKGDVFWKPLEKGISPDYIKDFEYFIRLAIFNFEYNDRVFLSSAKKLAGCLKCNKYTNCGELVFLSLIYLGLIPLELYYTNIWHHLKYICRLKDCIDNNYICHVKIIK